MALAASLGWMTRCRLRVDEVVGLCLVTLTVIEMCLHFFGLRDPVALVAIAIGCASHSAQRLLQVRRFGAAAARRADLYTVMAVTPFMLLPVLHAVNPGSGIWQPASAQMTRYLGVALALGLAVPHAAYIGAPRTLANLSTAMASYRPVLLMYSVLLIVPSGVAALLTLCGLAAGVLGGRHLADRAI